MTFPSSIDTQAALKLAAEARARKREEWSKLKLRQNFLDKPCWAALASKYKVRMPPAQEPCSLKRMRAYVRRVGLAHIAQHELESFIELNKDWPLYTFVGLLLEEREYNETRT